MQEQNISNNKRWWTGFKGEHNFTLENGLLTVYIYDPPPYSHKEIKAELNPHTPFGHELSHLLSGAFYFKGFDPSGAYIWGEKIDDSFDPGRALFYESWVIHGQVLSDANIDLDFKLEHHAKGRFFLEDTFPMLYKVPIPDKWVQRWDKLKEQIDELTNFRKELTIDPWWPKGFERIRLGKLK
ncbi:MAG: hypothetical protein A3B68_01075 [Candidatus Melainabacteria bacterium RIFCSPHIGHO2_02_FULL_34_12]|nr:MAG: hypothetical protein A3B68_01075 [Candidatus Melainabacteria bacterium RIFCSPHIGHO2_02_FULL_34_12]